MDDPVIVMGICGTFDLDSANGRLLNILLEKCRSVGAETTVWNNGNTPLPMVGEDGCWSHPNVKAYKEMAD
ncbi:MAG: hypothetical protein QF612_06425, partial [Candidatus Thalassarchaeaceae archaeon]|nr:hypothetical protein [Candidatus Thalassarchaeaceae archaeon]